jgi:hypothetical protein
VPVVVLGAWVSPLLGMEKASAEYGSCPASDRVAARSNQLRNCLRLVGE